ncbi:hypothetical protein R3P38DRAFT_2574935 [Favolaschia claudopus]|uniref:F-box domain-containing protein n=1 Tax=Favolaschia claudopus TaxID=2862362 RepID=A0AAV9ZLX8_9AGAR
MEHTNPLRIPELLHEILAAFNPSTDRSSLLSLSMVDRFTHTVAAPYLFRHICTNIDRIGLLASAFKSDLSRASLCRSLAFVLVYDTTRREPVLPEDIFNTLYDDLVTVFTALSLKPNLHTLIWNKAFYGCSIALPQRVWTAIASALPSVEILKLYVTSYDWESVMQTQFIHLRVFELNVGSFHGWDCTPLVNLLQTLHDLEQLSLELPSCSGPVGLTLQSTHPRLKRFSFTSGNLFSPSDFLIRHPHIETLYLESEQQFDHPNQPSFRALCMDEYCLRLPSQSHFIQPPLAHLFLRDLEDQFYQSDIELAIVECHSLRCLEVDCFRRPEEEPVPPSVNKLIQKLPALEELALLPVLNLAGSEEGIPAVVLLNAALESIEFHPSLRALRLFNRSGTLPQERLDDLGCLPPNLKYIGCDGLRTSLIYVVDRQGGKNFVSKTIRRDLSDDWVERSILGFLSECS